MSSADAKTPSAADVAGRVAHFRDLEFTQRGHLDTFIPGHERETVAVIGGGVMEDPSHAPAVVAADGFHVTYARVKPGHGNALHDHATVEVFIPMSGRWSIRCGAGGEHETILEAWDVISIPPGIQRSYTNIGDGEAYLMAILGGDDPGQVLWPQRTLAEAARHGATLDEHGQVVRVTRAKGA
jgi:mannose-6-phosphate isomerase-like protein (cupin superfamily)